VDSVKELAEGTLQIETKVWRAPMMLVMMTMLSNTLMLV